MLIGCVNSRMISRKNLINTTDVATLLKELYEQDNENDFETLCIKLDNSIKKQNNVWVFVSEYVNEKNGVLFTKFSNMRCDSIQRMEDKLIDFDICIKTKDIILFNNKVSQNKNLEDVFDLEFRRKIWKEYLEAKSNNSKLRTIVRININCLEKDLVLVKEWRIFLNFLNETMVLFNNIRNDFSLNIYGLEFSQLKYHEKVHVLNTTNMGIVLTFNSGCKEPALPAKKHALFWN